MLPNLLKNQTDPIPITITGTRSWAYRTYCVKSANHLVLRRIKRQLSPKVQLFPSLTCCQILKENNSLVLKRHK